MAIYLPCMKAMCGKIDMKENKMSKLEFNVSSMCKWERQKAMYLLEVADRLDMDTKGHGQLAVNQNSGNTYLWLEYYPFCLFMPISCELDDSGVYASYYDPNDGEETEICVKGMSLQELYTWVESLEKPEDEE